MDAAPEARRVLVVEDEFMIADELVRTLKIQGFDVVGPVPTVGKALDLVESDGLIDGAILDVNLRNERIYAVADALRDRDIPFIFSTGYARGMLPRQYQDVPHFEKPVDPAKVLRLLFKSA